MSPEELVAKMQKHFQRISELLDYLDKVLPEHETKLKLQKKESMISESEIAAEAILTGMFEELVRQYYLPSWADAQLDGEWVQFAQLQTKDGRRMGNAVILAVDTVEWDGKPVELHTIITDFGNVLRLTEQELITQFHPPKWKMRANRVSHRVKFITSYYEDGIS